MSEKKYKKKIELQNKLISRQSEQIESLKLQVESLEIECKKKDLLIKSISSLNDEFKEKISEMEKYRKEYKGLIDELRKMKEIINQEVYKGRWKLVKFLIK